MTDLNPRQLTGADGVPHLWVDVAIDDQWKAACRIDLELGQVTVSQVNVEPLTDPPPAGGITARLLRQIRIGHLASDPEIVRYLHDEPSRLRFRNDLLPSTAVQRPGRGGRDSLFLARIAAGYLQLIQQGSRRPVWDLRDALTANGAGPFSAAGVRGFLNEARTRKLLVTPARKGEAGGQLTPKAVELLVAAGLMDRPTSEEGYGPHGPP